MALIITGNKGAIGVNSAYLVLTSVSVQKRMSMEVGNNVPFIAIVAQGSLFNSQAERMSRQAAPIMDITFSYTPTSEQYPVEGAYEQIKAYGIPGWSLSIIVDA